MRRWLIWLGVLGGTFLLLVAGLGYVFNYTELSVFVYGMGKGNPEYAHYWQIAFRDVATPEEAKALYPEVIVIRFGNGEWVFGVNSCSHRSHRGGTVVVKDSTGQIRAFFGHVCGNYFLEGIRGRSLEDFYAAEAWQVLEFQEYQLP